MKSEKLSAVTHARSHFQYFLFMLLTIHGC